MDLATFAILLGPHGQDALAAAEALAPTDAAFLACHRKLAKQFSSALAKAALETVLLRTRARPKFSNASCMYFTREALEQASGEAIARYRAQRMAGYRQLADLCCGVGGDMLALAALTGVDACDCDELRLAMAAANARACGVEAAVRCHRLDLEQAGPPPGVEAFFFDPDRRPGGRRRIALRDYRPSFSRLQAWLRRVPAAGVKVAPGVAREELEPFDAEREFISVDGELKECVLWFGPLRSAGWRATVLPGPYTLAGAPDKDAASCAPPKRIIYEPDPAVLRARLVGSLAAQLKAVQLDPEIAFLTADAVAPTPFAKSYEVEEHFPFAVKLLREALRARRIGRVDLKLRGSPLEPEKLRRDLKLQGDEARTVFVTRCAGRPWTVIARRVVG